MSSRSASWPPESTGQRQSARRPPIGNLKGFEGLAVADPSALIDPGGALDRSGSGQSASPQVEGPDSDSGM